MQDKLFKVSQLINFPTAHSVRPMPKKKKSNSRDKLWRVITTMKMTTVHSAKPPKTLMNQKAIRTSNKIKVKKVTKVFKIITIQKM